MGFTRKFEVVYRYGKSSCNSRITLTACNVTAVRKQIEESDTEGMVRILYIVPA